MRKPRPRKLDSLVTGQGPKGSEEMAYPRPVRVSGGVRGDSRQKKWAFRWPRGSAWGTGRSVAELRVLGRPGRAFGIYPEGERGRLNERSFNIRIGVRFPPSAPNCHDFQCSPAPTWRTLAGPGFWALPGSGFFLQGSQFPGKDVLLPPSGCGGPRGRGLAALASAPSQNSSVGLFFSGLLGPSC